MEKQIFSSSEENLFEGTLRQKQQKEERLELPKEEPAQSAQEMPEKEQKQLEPQESVPKKEEPKKEEPPTEKPQTEVPKREESTSYIKKQEEQQLELFEEKLLAPESRERIRLIGQVFDTYWLAQFGDAFYIIDQHAAHEKVYYERFVKKFRENTVDAQYLTRR